MADTKISALTAVTSVLGAQQIPCNDAGATKQMTVTQLGAFLGNTIRNASTSSQTITAATAYVTNSNLAVPVGKLAVGTFFRWVIFMTKTAAGSTAGSTILIKVGTAGTTGDATIITLTTGTPTAAADTGVLVVEAIIRGPLGASCIMAAGGQLGHNLAATGFSNIAGECYTGVSSGFDSTVANLIVGLTITTTTGSAWTLVTTTAEAYGM